MPPGYPRISVVIPSYNQSRFLELTIISIITQNYPNTELIIMDGGSTDNSVAIIKKYSKYIYHWESKSDGGQVNAIIEGFKKSSGVILTYINSDDCLIDGVFINVANSYNKHKNKPLLLYGNYYIIDEDGNIQETIYTPSYMNWVFWNLRSLPFSQPGTFFTRNLYELVGGFNTQFHYSFDKDLFLRIIKTREKVIKIPHFNASFRYYKSQKGHSKYWLNVAKSDSKEITKIYYSNNSKGIYYFFAKIIYYVVQIINLNFIRMLTYRIYKRKSFRRYNSQYSE